MYKKTVTKIFNKPAFFSLGFGVCSSLVGLASYYTNDKMISVLCLPSSLPFLLLSVIHLMQQGLNNSKKLSIYTSNVWGNIQLKSYKNFLTNYLKISHNDYEIKYKIAFLKSFNNLYGIKNNELFDYDFTGTIDDFYNITANASKKINIDLIDFITNTDGVKDSKTYTNLINDSIHNNEESIALNKVRDDFKDVPFMWTVLNDKLGYKNMFFIAHALNYKLSPLDTDYIKKEIKNPCFYGLSPFFIDNERKEIFKKIILNNSEYLDLLEQFFKIKQKSSEICFNIKDDEYNELFDLIKKIKQYGILSEKINSINNNEKIKAKVSKI